MRRWQRLASICALLLGLLAAPQPSIQASAPPGPFFQGFEQNTDGWFSGADRNIVRRPSGWVPTSGSNYGPGIPSAAGHWHARLEDSDGCTTSCDGPFTRWGGYSSVFPEPGYKTELDIYLDVNWAMSHQDVRFDWISAINNSDGSFHRDFVFNVGTQLAQEPPHFIIQSSTNSTRSGANPHAPCPNPAAPPNNGCRPPLIIDTSGWYTFRHTFRDGGDGFLDVDFDIFALGNPTPLIHWTIDGDRLPPDDGDPMSTMGGNRYGWFSNEEVPDLAIDNSLRVGLCRAGGGDGDVQDDNSGRHGHAHFNGKKCEDGSESGDVEESDQSSGDNFQSDSVTGVTFTQDESSQTLTMVGTGSHNGLPVAFTMVSVDNGTLAPALFSLVLSDGYAIAGSVTSGTISIG